MPETPHITERAEQPYVAVQRWGARLENCLTDPADEPDLANWHTELAFRLAD